MKLIVGLGNPGKQYEQTRHNAGFMVIDTLSKELGVGVTTNKFKGLIGETRVGSEKVILLKPQTYMNLSGESVQAAMRFYNLEPEDVLVIYDDLDLPVGKIRIREKGSAGGQNGMKNIIQHLGTQTFGRIRVGIDKDKQIATVDYVLGKFRPDQQEPFQQACDQAQKAAIDWVKNGLASAMNQFNKK
ncbi:MAG: aminoacyl-tRNA hydrolase [Erysipelotrichaceae bacterium]